MGKRKVLDESSLLTGSIRVAQILYLVEILVCAMNITPVPISINLQVPSKSAFATSVLKHYIIVPVQVAVRFRRCKFCFSEEATGCKASTNIRSRTTRPYVNKSGLRRSYRERGPSTHFNHGSLLCMSEFNALRLRIRMAFVFSFPLNQALSLFIVVGGVPAAGPSTR